MTEMSRTARLDLELLSAFLDGELSPAEAEKLEARLATDKQLSGTFEALRATSEVVGSLPEVRPPRSFALTQELVRPRRAYPILQLGTAMAALGFVLVVGADLLLSSAAGSRTEVPEQAFFAADQLDEQPLPAAGDAAPAEAPVLEDAIIEEAEMESALPEAESVGEAEDGAAQDFFRSDEDAADAELADESAAAPRAEGESEIAGESVAEPEAGALARESAAEPEAGAPAGESAVEPEAGALTEEAAAKSEADGDAEIAVEAALEPAADEELSAGRLTANELDFSDEEPSVSLSLLRVIEIGLAAALIVLIGLTLWVRQRG